MKVSPGMTRSAVQVVVNAPCDDRIRVPSLYHNASVTCSYYCCHADFFKLPNCQW